MGSVSMTPNSAGAGAARERARSNPPSAPSSNNSDSNSGSSNSNGGGNRARSETGPAEMQPTPTQMQAGRIQRPSRALSAPVGVPESLLQAYPDPVVAPSQATRERRASAELSSLGSLTGTSPPKAATAIAGPAVPKGKGGKLPRRKSSPKRMLGFGRRTSNPDASGMADDDGAGGAVGAAAADGRMLAAPAARSESANSVASTSSASGNGNGGEGAAVDPPQQISPPAPPLVSPAKIKKFETLLEMPVKNCYCLCWHLNPPPPFGTGVPERASLGAWCPWVCGDEARLLAALSC